MRRKAPRWPIDPEDVVLGSVAARGGPSLSRTHVQVRYAGRPTSGFVRISDFIKETDATLKRGRALRIESLRVAPLTKRKYSYFFDQLTDWSNAVRRATSRPKMIPPGKRPDV